jgi:hypothetical protein
VIAEDYSIACWSWITLRGPIEIELDEVLRRRSQEVGLAEGRARCKEEKESEGKEGGDQNRRMGSSSGVLVEVVCRTRSWGGRDSRMLL